MAVQGQWTDATRVRAYLKSGSALTDAQIEDIVANCEGYLRAYCKLPTTFTASESTRIHLALREAATLRAALLVLASTPLSHQTLAQASLTANIIFEMYQQSIKVLDDGGVVENMENPN